MNALALTYEDDRARRFRLLQQMDQQSGLVLDVIGTVIPLVNFFTLAGGGRCRDFYRFFQQAFSKIFNGVTFEGGGEQHRLLTPAGFTGNVFDILREAHIQHAVRFIKDQGFNGAAIKVFFFNILQQAAGRGDHNILVLAEHFSMVHIGDTAGNGGDIQMSMFCQLTRVVGNLHCQFASWGQDKNARRTRFLAWKIEQMLQRGQKIRRRFTGACRG